MIKTPGFPLDHEIVICSVLRQMRVQARWLLLKLFSLIIHQISMDNNRVGPDRQVENAASMCSLCFVREN